MGTASSTTVAAIASPPGAGSRGVVRLSGPRVRAIAAELHGGGEQARARRLFAGPRNQWTAAIDDGAGVQPALVLWTPAPRSYTAEDVCELHLCGAPCLLDRVLERLFALGAEPAGPGEFTRRAFLNGRIDLTRAEGVLELVESSNEAERRAAVELLEGGLARRIEGLREGLDDLRALCEASLDFDESDTGHVPLEELLGGAERVAAGLLEAEAWEVRRMPASAQPRIVMVGAPNAGKSSLFNALTRGQALVSPTAGSTRDGVVGTWELAGVPCSLADSPGLDAAARGADARAQELAGRERAAADLCLWVVDGARVPDSDELDREGRELPAAAAKILVWNKVDLPGAGPAPAGAVPCSARTGSGLAQLADRAARDLGLGGALAGAQGEGAGASRPTASSEPRPSRELSARHREALARGSERLERARSELAAGVPLDFAAETLREATEALDGIRGTTTAEDLLGRIFARFCIGK